MLLKEVKKKRTALNTIFSLNILLKTSNFFWITGVDPSFCTATRDVYVFGDTRKGWWKNPADNEIQFVVTYNYMFNFKKVRQLEAQFLLL